MKGLAYLFVIIVVICLVFIFDAGSVYKNASGQEQCNNQTGNNCVRSRFSLPLPFDDGSVDPAEGEQADDENDDKDFDSGSENELPLPLPFPWWIKVVGIKIYMTFFIENQVSSTINFKKGICTCNKDDL